jgi:hypothetical protein
VSTQLAERLLAAEMFPDLPFPRPVRRRARDYPVRALEVAWADVRGRNPPPPPWRRRAAADWQTTASGPGPSLPQRSVPLIFGVAAVWNEEDVVAATVSNLFEQGADRVVVIDDGSDDDTRSEAAAVGAVVVGAASDGVYSEAARGAQIRSLVETETARAGGDVWWVVADADEFPRGGAGAMIREVVRELPGWVDVVGARVLDHVPPSADDYPHGAHPLPYFPLARWYVNPYCRAGHWKHPLFRVRSPGDVYPTPGHHVVGTGDGRRAREASTPILVHHFPFRNRQRTEGKLRRAAAAGGRYDRSPDRFTRRRLAQRLASLDDLYRGRYDLVAGGYPGGPRIGFSVCDWRELVAAVD